MIFSMIFPFWFFKDSLNMSDDEGRVVILLMFCTLHADSSNFRKHKRRGDLKYPK